MSQPVDRAGQFRGVITEYGLKEMDSGAVAVSIKARLDQIWTGEEWQDWSEYGMEAQGDVWIIGKDGKPSERAANSLIEFAGWDGNLLSIAQEGWKPTPSQFAIKDEEYKGKTYHRIAFVNDHDRVPGGNLSNIDEKKAKTLQDRFGSAFKAIAGNAKRAGSIPAAPPKNGNGVKPPIPRATPTPDSFESLPARAGSEADIPF